MATAKLVCKQCNFENEPERVYCHNCGAKLDRSLLPPEVARREEPAAVQQRVRKMVSPKRTGGLQGVKTFIGCTLLAAVLASLLLTAKPPADVPAVSKDAMLSAPTVTTDLETLVEQPAHAQKYTEEGINAFLQYSLRGKPNGTTGTTIMFERAFVRFKEGTCAFTVQRSLFGLPIYTTTVRTVQLKDGKIMSDPLAASIGSLRIPGPLLPVAEGLFTPIWKVLDQDKALIAKLQSITFHDKSVEMTSKPATAGR